MPRGFHQAARGGRNQEGISVSDPVNSQGDGTVRLRVREPTQPVGHAEREDHTGIVADRDARIRLLDLMEGRATERGPLGHQLHGNASPAACVAEVLAELPQRPPDGDRPDGVQLSLARHGSTSMIQRLKGISPILRAPLGRGSGFMATVGIHMGRYASVTAAAAGAHLALQRDR